MIKKISYVCMCTILSVGILAFSACSNNAAPTPPANNTPSKPEKPKPQQPAPDVDIYGEYKGTFNASPVSFVLSKTHAKFYSQVMSPEYSNITFTDKKDGKWLIECYDDGAAHTPQNLKVDALINTKKNPYTAVITIHGMGGQQVNCEKTGGEPGLKIEGTILKGYRGSQPEGVLVVPAGITAIDTDAFKGCTGLSAVRFPSTLTQIAAGAFKACTGLKKLEFPENLTTIGDEAFEGCSGITELNFSQCTKLIRIEDNVFADCKAITGELKLPQTLTAIGKGAFSGCEGISGKLALPANLTKIGQSAFLKCKNIDEVDFSACTQLTNIERNAFNRCTKLTKVTLPKSLTTIGNIFTGCTNLSQLSVDSENSALCAENNIVYNKAKTELIFAAPAVAEAVAMPSTLTVIRGRAFINNQALTKVKFPANLTEIGDSAFSTCKGLQIVDFSESIKLEKIIEHAFDYCENISGTLLFPASLTEIEEFAFNGCKKVTEMNFTNCTQLTAIGTKAFQDCTCRFKVKAGSGVKEKLITAGVDSVKIDEE